MHTPTERFSNRVDNYARYRPTYPAEALAILQRDTGLTPSWTVADIGSGTGISAELLLRNGNCVYGVEPNEPMRQAAERLLAGFPNFHSVAGTAERTTLADDSVDCVLAAQAFHWFDGPQTRTEFKRILRPPAWTVLMWNTRQTDSTPFLRAYEDLLQRHGTDYRQVRHENIDAPRLDAFFGPGRWQPARASHIQQLTLEGLRGRLLSSSYLPAEGAPGCERMLADLDELFAAHHQTGRISLVYDTEIYFGRLE